MVHVIKVFLEGFAEERQIRRVAVGSDVLSRYDLLFQRIHSLFPLLHNKMIELKWKDSEDDFIHMSSDAELAQALANADEGLLKIYVQEIGAKKERKNRVAHPHVICDGCDKPLSGDRYKCIQCQDFDLCSGCNAFDKHPDHDFIKLVKPANVPREWLFLGARKFWKSMFHSSNQHCHKEGKNSPTASNEHVAESSAKTFQENISTFLNGDFTTAQKLLNENLAHLFNLGEVEISVGKCPFKAEFKPKKPEAENNTGEKVAKDSNPATPPEDPSAKKAEVETPLKGDAETPLKGDAETPLKGDAETPSAQNKEKETAIPMPACSNEESATGDDWTVVCGDEPECVASTQPKVMYPDLEQRKQEQITNAHSRNPSVLEALLKMESMGFTNEGGWLERLLVAKDANLNHALDALYPGARPN